MSKSSRASLTKWSAIGFMILASACWGSATVMSKGALKYLPPLTLLATQLAASITFLWIAVFKQNQHLRLKWKNIKLAFTGLLEPGLAYTFGVVGLSLTTASNASIINTTEPIIIMIISWILLREKVTKNIIFVAIIALIGVILLGGANLVNLKINFDFIWGNLLILIGTSCAALYVVLSHRLVENIAPLPLAALQQTVGFIWAVLIWRVGIIREENFNFSEITLNIWGLAIASGIVQYALAFWFYLIGLKSMPANIAALFLNLIPVFGVGGAYVFLGEKLTTFQWIGTILIIVAVVKIFLLPNNQAPSGQGVGSRE